MKGQGIGDTDPDLSSQRRGVLAYDDLGIGCETSWCRHRNENRRSQILDIFSEWAKKQKRSPRIWQPKPAPQM